MCLLFAQQRISFFKITKWDKMMRVQLISTVEFYEINRRIEFLEFELVN